MTDPEPEFTDTDGAARFTGIAATTLTTLRSRGGGPTFLKVGSRVMYAITDLREWMLADRRELTK